MRQGVHEARTCAPYAGKVDPQALDLATKTLAQAIDALMAKGAPLVPLVMVQRGNERQVQRITATRNDDAEALAKQVASSQADADVSAFAVGTAIPFDNQRFEAIVVEAWNFRTHRGARVGLRYELKGVVRKKAQLIGGPLYLGKQGWHDPEDSPTEIPTFPEPAPVSVVATHDFGPPPTTDPVALDPPPGYEPPSHETSRAAPPLDFPPPVIEAHPLVETSPAPTPTEQPVAPPAPAPAPASVPVEPERVYTTVPIQRNETPLGNRAMFTGVMELATKGRTFPAFAIVQKGGVWEQVTMTDPNLADTAASVRAYARTRTDADFIAFAVDAFVSVNGADVTAVVVEVWEYATRVSFSVAQRYVPTGDPPSPRLSGRPLMRTQAGWVDVPSSMTLGGQVQFAYNDPSS